MPHSTEASHVTSLRRFWRYLNREEPVELPLWSRRLVFVGPVVTWLVTEAAADRWKLACVVTGLLLTLLAVYEARRDTRQLVRATRETTSFHAMFGIFKGVERLSYPWWLELLVGIALAIVPLLAVIRLEDVVVTALVRRGRHGSD